jgi:hypothetical protein
MLPAPCAALCLLQLPRDVLRYVFSSPNLDVLSIALSRFVCRALHALVPLPRRRLSGIPIYLVDKAVRRRDLKLAMWCAERLCRKAQEVYEHIPALEAVSTLAARLGDVPALQRCMQLGASLGRSQLAKEVPCLLPFSTFVSHSPGCVCRPCRCASLAEVLRRLLQA